MSADANRTQHIDNPVGIAVVIPSYRVSRHIHGVIARIPALVSMIFVVDDACPEGSGDLVEKEASDPRVVVIRHQVNQGVGGAVMTGYLAAVEAGASVIVKIDGDGQMAPEFIGAFVEPILRGEADYTKGNRFFDLERVREMPPVRLFGNAVLSFMAKLSTGYYDLFDPTNGYTAIHAGLIKLLPLDKISKRYFFETDMLFRLNTVGAVVVDIAMAAKYGEEVSNLKIKNILGEFLLKHIRNFFKRIFYSYYLRSVSVASLELPIGLLMLAFGVVYGATNWIESSLRGTPTPAGTVMLAALPVLMGLQLVLAFLSYDVSSVPKRPRQLSMRSTLG
jgi:glycosyltransferase involved in cell wall biosynthesis